MAFQKGQSGNPEGTQTNKPFLAALTRAIKQEDAKRLRQSAEKLLDAASNGEPWAIAMLADRTDGKAAQSVMTEHKGTVAIEHSKRPQLSKDEWLALHGLGTTVRPAD